MKHNFVYSVLVGHDLQVFHFSNQCAVLMAAGTYVIRPSSPTHLSHSSVDGCRYIFRKQPAVTHQNWS